MISIATHDLLHLLATYGYWAVLVIIALLIFVRRNEQRLEAEAERALPGPLDAYQPQAGRGQAPRQSVRLSDSTQEETEPTRSAEHMPPTSPGGSTDRAEPGEENTPAPEPIREV